MSHIPVFLNEAIKQLNLKSGDNIIDCTLGDGGHAKEILKKTEPNGKLLGIDADNEAIIEAKKNLSNFNKRIIFVNNNFSNLENIVKKEFNFKIQGIILDLGWSTTQFETRGRGFSFLKNEPLDMRYSDKIASITAKEIINNYNERELEKMFWRLGEEKFSKRIAKEIILERNKKEILSTKQLADIVVGVYKSILKSKSEIPRIGKIHPATKVFQALRIEVNDELGALKQALPQALKVLNSKGRLVVITFHSLEDRLVKRYFETIAGKVVLITKKPIKPDLTEITNNPRSRSAKMRVIEKI